MNELQVPRSSSGADDGQEAALPQATPAPKPVAIASDGVQSAAAESASLNAYDDARALVRLIQCSQCSYPLRTPVTLPCGNSLCKECLPPAHIRENISYPALTSRQSGITCPFSQCQLVHSLEDCSVSVALYKVVDEVSAEVARARAKSGERKTSMEEMMHSLESPAAGATSDETGLVEKGHARTLSGSRLVATFTFAELGELPYTSDVTYHPTGNAADQDPTLDTDLLQLLKDLCVKEFDCHVCYNMMLDPVTAPCGHTFCRKCLTRILDHSTLCPHCRRALPLPPSLKDQKSNKYLTELLSSLCPDQVAARQEAADAEERSAPGGLDTAIFACTVSFPYMPMILHIFEPRYRLMVRRALESNHQFGMVAVDAHHEPMDYGIMLQIDHCRLQPDGRSWLVCHGLSRFRTVERSSLDGYLIGRVETHSDMSLAEEERLEADETSAPAVEGSDAIAQLDRMPTAELLAIGVNFVRHAEEHSAHWLAGTIREIYGGMPQDAATFPYWFASVAPLPDMEKYKLLPTTSVRERLKIVASWVRRIEAQRW